VEPIWPNPADQQAFASGLSGLDLGHSQDDEDGTPSAGISF
jgi:hypothetical protein